MGENYANAAMRHWHDAQLLERESRIENADQLYGLSAECAIKKVLLPLPAFSDSGSLIEDYKHHVNVLWNKARHQSIEKCAPTLPTLLRIPNPFSDWHVDQRYSADGAVSLQAMQAHRDFTKRLLGAVGLTGVRRK